MLRELWSRLAKTHHRTSDIVWVDLGNLGDLVAPCGPHEQWHDHGLGLLRTILHLNGLLTDVLSTRAVTSWAQLRSQLHGYRTMIMNVRSYSFPHAAHAAKIFKQVNPDGLVLTGGLHASVALEEMKSVQEFDHICQGPGEKLIVDLVRSPASFPRVSQGVGERSMALWPMIDRSLWPRPASRKLARRNPWPLEPDCGWGPGPVATLLTSSVCPWQCAFCNEGSFIPNMLRKPVEMAIDELNHLDEIHGPIGSVVIHDSMFFQNPAWLLEWLEKYPRKANKIWPYWAAARSDTIRRWPDLFEALIRETNWKVISVGFESGSNRVLRLLNKECTAEDNSFAIDLLERIGNDLEQKGRTPPQFWANIMLGVPGETRQDAFMTMSMVKSMRRAMVSPSCYAPYPGSALGYQLIAEGKSRMSSENYHRFPGDEKVEGVDYNFYRELLAGKHDHELALSDNDHHCCSPSHRHRHALCLFELRNGKKKLAYGASPKDALDILRMRLSPTEMKEIIPDKCTIIRQRKLQEHVHALG